MGDTRQMLGELLLRTPDGRTYGPVDMVTLCAWATDGRIIPGCALSVDRTDWVSAETFPELRLNWMIGLPDGTVYGPLNLLAIWALAQDDAIPRGVTLTERSTQHRAVLDESIHPLLIEESRHMFAASGRLAADLLALFRASQEGTQSELRARDDQVARLREQLADVERDLRANLALVGESQRYLAHQEDASRTAETRVREAASLRSELDGTKAMLEEAQRRGAAADRDLAAEREAREAQGLLLDATRKRLEETAERERGLAKRLAAVEQEAHESGSALVELRDRAGRLQELVAEADARARDLMSRLAAAEDGARRLSDELQASLARERELRERLAASTSEQEDMRARLSAAEQAADRSGSELREVSQREAALKRELAVESGRLRGENDRLTGELERERAARAASDREREAAAASHKEEMDRWESRFQAALVGVQKMEATLQEREHALTALRHQAERTEAELNGRVGALRKEAESANRRVQELKGLCEEAEREGVRIRAEGEQTARTLREELAAVQRDFSSIMMANDYTRQTAGPSTKPAGTAINWLDNGRSQGSGTRSSRPASELQESLQQRLKASIEEKETLRIAMKRLQDERDVFAAESQQRIAQLQQQARTSSDLVQQALEELERREAQIRSLRKKTEEREQELLARIEELEATERQSVVVEPEVLGPGTWESPGAGEGTGKARVTEAAPGSAELLSSVEAQLRSELRQWETLSRRRGKRSGSMSNWFGRKSP